MKIAFVSSALQQPRHQKRIDLLRGSFAVEVFYFYRNKYVENLKGYEAGATMVGRVEDGRYIARIWLLLKLLWLLSRSDADVVYCTSPDQALMACFTRKKVILEVGDLYQVDGRGKFFRLLDHALIPRLSGLIITSPGFYSGYFSRFEKCLLGKVLVVENKLPPSAHGLVNEYRTNYRWKSLGKTRLGVIGSLSFARSLLELRKYVEASPHVELHVFGDGLHSIFDGLDNAHYHGRFKNPEDLSRIYGEIDINIILYDNDSVNVRLALPNKLYESIAFLRPIVCSDKVLLADVVRREGLGQVVVDGGIGDAVAKAASERGEIVARMQAQPASAYLCFEQADIVSFINKLVGSGGGARV